MFDDWHYRPAAMTPPHSRRLQGGSIGQPLLLAALLALCLAAVTVGAQQPVHFEISASDVPDVLNLDTMDSVSTATAAAATTGAAADPLLPFDLSQHRSASSALLDYARWHNRTVADARACKETGVLVWSAAAGFGDSVNALTTAFRYALGSSRLFFIRWRSRNDKHVWRIGLQAPGFAWDYDEAVAAMPHCQLSEDALHQHAAFSKSATGAAGSGTKPVRVASISGSITSDHPLSGSLDALYSDYKHVVYGLTDAVLQGFLLRPNADLDDWIRPVRLQLKRRRTKDFVGVVGMQLRSGYADAAEEAHRPRNANFLAAGDELLFLERLDSIVQLKCAGHANRTRVFLMTDSPQLRETITLAVDQRHGGRMAVVSATDGAVAHCGPARDVSREGALRMLTEWFVFKRHVDFAIITAWSLFGASACEGKSENFIWRIDASNCGQPGAKPCQMS